MADAAGRVGGGGVALGTVGADAGAEPGRVDFGRLVATIEAILNVKSQVHIISSIVFAIATYYIPFAVTTVGMNKRSSDFFTIPVMFSSRPQRDPCLPCSNSQTHQYSQLELLHKRNESSVEGAIIIYR